MAGISVIVATYNRSGVLRGALEALAAQEDPGVPVSVVVADNGSTDDTRAVFEQVAPTRPDFAWTYLLETTAGKSHAVNGALAQAPGDWLAFTDDDVRPDSGWLSAIVRAFRASNADFIVGRIQPIWQTPPPAWVTPALYGALGVPDNGTTPCSIEAGHNEPIMPIGTNMAVRASAATRVGGLHPDLGKMRGTLRTGEDHDFYVRLLEARCRGRYVPDALVHHLVPGSRLVRGYFRRWFYQNGRNVATIEAGYPRRMAVLFGVPRYQWREAAANVARLAAACVGFDAPQRLRRLVSLLWFAGYVRETWFGRHQSAAALFRPSRVES